MEVNRVVGSAKRKLLWFIAIVIATALLALYLSFRHQRRAFAERTHCVGNLVHLEIAKSACQEDLGLADGNPIPEQALAKSFSDLGLGSLGACKCPSGGTYLIGKAGSAPKCSYTNVCYTYRFAWLKCERRAWKHTLEP